MDEIVGDGRQRSEAVSQGSEDETGHKRLASHVTRRYVTANWLANGILADHTGYGMSLIPPNGRV